MPTVGKALAGNGPEIGIVADEKILFSSFSFFGKTGKRLDEEIARRSWEHDPGLDVCAGELLSRAMKGDDVFDWSLLSPAQSGVLKELRGVRGTITYGELAKRCGTGPRAVGAIMRSNPFAYFVPCHRVVGKDGPGGFSSGVSEKIALLRKEGL